ncbi:F0F1 ATP synthase subunit delta [Anaerophilus nitritogenes]|uniref:F0F1 ATP synthase subunit delta n=1 Tax=Anaerophilus nitritogenes TaxID=2498136 RepID=UPI00101C7A0B|nr:F0F1 ATP synthase subunit delta [Anaerophilus nitritogenes]
MAKLIEKTYAQALFELAVEKDTLDLYREELSFVVKTFKEYKDFYKLYKAYQMSKEEKKKMLDEVFKTQISKEVINFLKILIDKNRYMALEGIEKEYTNIVNHHYGRVEGIVWTSILLKEDEKLMLEQKLSKMQDKEVKLTNKIDPSIIGGVFVKIGDQIIDGTLKNRLDLLKQELAQIIV